MKEYNYMILTTYDSMMTEIITPWAGSDYVRLAGVGASELLATYYYLIRAASTLVFHLMKIPLPTFMICALLCIYIYIKLQLRFKFFYTKKCKMKEKDMWEQITCHVINKEINMFVSWMLVLLLRCWQWRS